jgi:2-dehydro-3-deoxygluconokinase
MGIELRKDAAWALLAPTSMGVRLTPVGRQPFHASSLLALQVTSAESNVVSIASSLGLPVKVLTAFVKASPVSRLIRDNLAGRHIDVEAKEVAQGGPWGYRHQFNLADAGFGARGPRVHNDRAGEVGRTLSAADFDLERIFAREGVKIVHLSGLVAALSAETAGFCREIARVARRTGARVCFDLNYRASFWKGREEELRGAFREIAGLSDILVGNEEDFQLSLGIPGPTEGGVGLGAKVGGFREMIDRARAGYPGVRVFATTLREVESAGRHLWGALLWEGGSWHVAEPRPVEVLDRIGGGDAFVGGLLYGVLKEWEPARWLGFGWACGALAVTLETDYAMPADEEQVWSIWEGNARVSR